MSSHSDDKCKCTSEHNFKTTSTAGVGGGKLMEAYCDLWSSGNLKWCWLPNFPEVSKCPGATKSGSRDAYWTDDENICKGLQPFVLDLS